jgi:hypothetical protein
MEKDSKYRTYCCVVAMASMVLQIKFNNYSILEPGELSIVTCNRMNGLGFKFQWGQKIFLYPQPSRLALGHAHPSVQWILGLSPWEKWPGNGFDQSPPSSAEVELFCYFSVLVWHVVGRTLPLIIMYV